MIASLLEMKSLLHVRKTNLRRWSGWEWSQWGWPHTCHDDRQRMVWLMPSPAVSLHLMVCSQHAKITPGYMLILTSAIWLVTLYCGMMNMERLMTTSLILVISEGILGQRRGDHEGCQCCALMDLLVRNIRQRFKTFLKQQTRQKTRRDHWYMQFAHNNLPVVAALMILSGHLKTNLKCLNERDSLIITDSSCFIKCENCPDLFVF